MEQTSPATTSEPSARAGAPDTTVFPAFAVGFVSFLSPCVLPLVPGYLSAVCGVSLDELRRASAQLRRVLSPRGPVLPDASPPIFVLLGMTATGLGSTLQDNRERSRRSPA